VDLSIKSIYSDFGLHFCLKFPWLIILYQI